MPRMRFEGRGGIAIDDDDLSGWSGDQQSQSRQDRAGAANKRVRRATRRPSFEDAPAGRRQRADGRESFKCGHCRAFIGPTVSGGRHRNHCPLCLYSRHVDGRQPGDRASRCRSLMAPVGVFVRPKGEQVVLHRCLGCELERHCRIAADDNPVALLRLPPVPPRTSRPVLVAEAEEEAIA